jgi:ABC-type nitrate/sulfonate/bicarbonate transport system substrate-binding protein
MAYRANVKDTDQTAVESKQFSGGIPVFTQASSTRIVVAGGGGRAKAQGGIVVPHGNTLKDFGDLVGKR